MNGPMTSDQLGGWVTLLVIVGLFALMCYRRPWRASSSAHGTAHFASDEQCKRAGMMGDSGLLLGRSLTSGNPLRMMRYVHLAIFGQPGSGKGVSFSIPWLLTYDRGSLAANDPKGELHRATSERRRQMGQIVIRLDPFGVCGKGADSFNPLDLIGSGPGCVDDCRALAEAMVTRTGNEHDPVWNDNAANFITGILAYICVAARPHERNLAALRTILTGPGLLDACAVKLQQMGGVFANLGGVMLTPAKEEKASILSSVNRHTTFLDSVAIFQATQSGWDAREFTTGQVATYWILPAHQMEAQSRWLRLVSSSLLRLVGREGMGGKEALFLLDEAATLGHMQPIEQGLNLLRASGLRLVLMYQSLGQLRECWKEKESVLLDATDQIYLGAQGANAKTLSERIGNYTETATSYSENEGTSRQQGGLNPHGGVTATEGSSTTTSVHSRALLTPDEIERLPPIVSIAFIRGLPPLLCKRVLYYSDPLFTGRKSLPFLKGITPWKDMSPLTKVVVIAAYVAAVTVLIKLFRP